ncbi:hypothetical protein EF834_16485 [Rhodococcus spongiicola]|uniref:Uncharacterized protein n=1 Tax=Rhodococcus spongiicola TaxID=2487352 RepID=A0A438AQL8_9NOCA|nr:hypothetical protein EF834_16485 [Rhodococcus spongiicola]
MQETVLTATVANPNTDPTATCGAFALESAKLPDFQADPTKIDEPGFLTWRTDAAERVAAGAEGTFTVDLAAGEYAVVGECVSDGNPTLFGTEQLVTSSHTLEAPTLTTAVENTVLTATVANTNVDPTATCGIIVLESAKLPDFQADPTKIDEPGFLTFRTDAAERVAAGAEGTFTVDLAAGEYAVVGECVSDGNPTLFGTEQLVTSSHTLEAPTLTTAVENTVLTATVANTNVDPTATCGIIVLESAKLPDFQADPTKIDEPGFLTFRTDAAERVAAGAEGTFTVDLAAGEYAVVGECVSDGNPTLFGTEELVTATNALAGPTVTTGVEAGTLTITIVNQNIDPSSTCSVFVLENAKITQLMDDPTKIDEEGFLTWRSPETERVGPGTANAYTVELEDGPYIVMGECISDANPTPVFGTQQLVTVGENALGSLGDLDLGDLIPDNPDDNPNPDNPDPGGPDQDALAGSVQKLVDAIDVDVIAELLADLLGGMGGE